MCKEQRRNGVNMEKEDIRINKAILHILDSTMGMPVLSDAELSMGSDFCDFLRTHIFRFITGDDIKNCTFRKEESEVFRALQDYTEENFIPISKLTAGILYEIMNANIDIPQGDFLIVEYQIQEKKYLAYLKMNYKTFYTHRTEADPFGNSNTVTTHRAILPSEGQRLTEAAIIDLETFELRVAEKKYEINGKKMNYFSQIFLKCNTALSEKSKLALVTKAVEDVQKKYYGEDEQFEASMEVKKIIHQELEEQGALHIPQVIDKIFKEKEEYKQEVEEKLEKYHIAEESVIPQNESTTKKFQKQYLTTDTGIEIKIPMEQYNNPDHFEFITNSDGTISVLIKNIGHIISK